MSMVSPDTVRLLQHQLHKTPAHIDLIPVERGVFAGMLTEIATLQGLQSALESDRATVIQRVTMEFCLYNVAETLRGMAVRDWGTMTIEDVLLYAAKSYEETAKKKAAEAQHA